MQSHVQIDSVVLIIDLVVGIIAQAAKSAGRCYDVCPHNDTAHLSKIELNSHPPPYL